MPNDDFTIAYEGIAINTSDAHGDTLDEDALTEINNAIAEELDKAIAALRNRLGRKFSIGRENLI